jgi:hypothetical protein
MKLMLKRNLLSVTTSVEVESSKNKATKDTTNKTAKNTTNKAVKNIKDKALSAGFFM